MAQNPITAVVLRDGALEWTGIRPAKNRYEVADHRNVKAAGADLAAPELAGALKSACDHARGELCAAIPTGKVLLRVVDLPTIDPAEMKSMAELQVDKFSPFPIEHMAVSYEPLAQKGNSSRVLIATVQRDILTALGAAFGKAGRLPRWIDVEVMGWWYLLTQSGEVPGQGRRVFLLLDATGTELIISQDGIPVVFRSLGLAQGVSEEEFFTELADEINYTLTTLEAERGAVESPVLALWFWSKAVPPKVTEGESATPAAEAPAGEPPPDLVAKLREACGVDIEARPFENLPPLSEGLARRAAGRGQQAALDLAPPEWRTENQARRTRKALLAATAVFLGLWLVGVSGFVGGLKLEQKRLTSVKAQVTSLEGPAEEVRQLKEKIAEFELYADRSHSGLECLREVSTMLPQGVELSSFSYKKGESVSVRGQSATPEPIYDFFQALERDSFFTGTKPEGVRSKAEGNVQVSEFSVTASLPGGEEKKP